MSRTAGFLALVTLLAAPVQADVLVGCCDLPDLMVEAHLADTAPTAATIVIAEPDQLALWGILGSVLVILCMAVAFRGAMRSRAES